MPPVAVALDNAMGRGDCFTWRDFRLHSGREAMSKEMPGVAGPRRLLAKHSRG